MNTKKNIPFSPPDISQVEIDIVVDALKSGWITTGPKTKEFERQIASYCNAARAVCLNSATACMEMCLRVLGIKEGDEVITTAYTYTASASVINHVGAKIVMVDTLENSFEINYNKIADAITSKTKAIIPVDLAGRMCDYQKIFDVIESKKHLFVANNDIQKAFGRVVVLADAAHAFGAKQNGMPCGSLADFTSFSFHAVKNLTTAEGGALVWKLNENLDNDFIYKQLQLLSLHGQSKDALAKTQLGAWEYDIVAPNYKCNMTDVMAAIGLGQMQRYASMLERRKNIIEKYQSALKNCNVQTISHFDKKNQSSGHLFWVKLIDKDEQFRNQVIFQMAQNGIATNVHYKPLPMMTAYKNLGFDIKDYPNAFNQYKSEITLPLYSTLKDEDVDYIIENFLKIIG